MSEKSTGPDSFVRRSRQGKTRSYFRCPGCGVTIRKDGTQSRIEIEKHKASCLPALFGEAFELALELGRPDLVAALVEDVARLAGAPTHQK